MNNKRRGFLIYGSFFSLSGLLPSSISSRLGLDSKDSCFLAVFETFFPKSLSQSEYDILKKSYMDTDSLNEVYLKMKQNGKILNSESFYSNKGNKWAVVFDSKASYYRWCYDVVGSRYFDELKLLTAGFTVENYGYRIPSKFSKLNIKQLLSEVDRNNLEREDLHKTKAISDLNAFQRTTIS